MNKPEPVNINPRVPFETEPTPEQPPDNLDGYAILKYGPHGGLVFESLNGYKVPVFTADGIQEVSRDSKGMVSFLIKLVGVQVNRLGRSSTDSIVVGDNTKIYLRQPDGSLKEYEDVVDETKET